MHATYLYLTSVASSESPKEQYASATADLDVFAGYRFDENNWYEVTGVGVGDEIFYREESQTPKRFRTEEGHTATEIELKRHSKAMADQLAAATLTTIFDAAGSLVAMNFPEGDEPTICGLKPGWSFSLVAMGEPEEVDAATGKFLEAIKKNPRAMCDQAATELSGYLAQAAEGVGEAIAARNAPPEPEAEKPKPLLWPGLISCQLKGIVSGIENLTESYTAFPGFALGKSPYRARCVDLTDGNSLSEGEEYALIYADVHT